ncbi:MAG: 2OG-Fe(II) oxygenase [Pseudomonadota bacterium]
MDPIHPSVRAGVDRLAREFAAATPFRHVVVDGFLDEALCRRLLAEFPGFEARHAINELGQVGGKAVRPDVRDISATYRALDDHIRSPDFLDLVGRITGIPGLLYDPDYVGGGTHENVHGQGLDAHVDFNYHPGTRWHRRLNLIVYLNPEWDEAWGGALELQSDPWDPQHNRVRAVAPLFNRCVIFETNEISWHGFRRIELPEERRGLSRKSFAIYLYTRERPATETAPSHATVYVPDGMPEGLQAGAVLSAAQVEDLSARFAHLRGQLRFLYEREKQFTAQLAALEGALAEARAAAGFPLQGYAVATGAAAGYWPDGWCARNLALRFRTTRKASGLWLDAFVPAALRAPQRLSIAVGDVRGTLDLAPGARQSIEVPLRVAAGTEVELRVEAGADWTPAADGASGDQRPLAWKLVEAALRH